ncbi:MAG TPA: hypothetical protein V6D29_06775 [Leptolyngbyaceae cyanobacterium]
MQEGRISPLFWVGIGVVGIISVSALTARHSKAGNFAFGTIVAGLTAYAVSQDVQWRQQFKSHLGEGGDPRPARPQNPNSKLKTYYKNGKRHRKSWNPEAIRYASDSVPEVYLSQVARCTHNREVAERLLLQTKDSSSGKDWEWCVNKILWDIERGR